MSEVRTGKRPDLEIPGTTILHVLIGSQAHGTADEDSDRDERIVFVRPTETFFHFDNRGNPHGKDTVWVEDHETEDLTGWELGRFIKLAMNCNPTILEVLWAPEVGEANVYGAQLIKMRSLLLDKKKIRDAFLGYSNNQRKKMLEQPEVAWTRRNWKFAEAYIRVLYQGITLLQTGNLPVDLRESRPDIVPFLKEIKRGQVSAGKVIDAAREKVVELESAYQRSSIQTQEERDVTLLNNWLSYIRKEFWKE